MNRTPLPLSTLDAQRGLSLIELMIAMALGLFLLAGMTSIYVSSSHSHQELEKVARQIENGRYAAEMIREEAELAGFYGDYAPANTTTWSTPADPDDLCTAATGSDIDAKMAILGFSKGSPHELPTGLYGFESDESLPSCISDHLSGTDVLVVRRVSTEPIPVPTTNAPDIFNGSHFLQVSNCTDSPSEDSFRVSNVQADFVLHGVAPSGSPASCLNDGGTITTGGIEHYENVRPVRQLITRIYYVASCSDCSGSGDGIPTLKMAELNGNGLASTLSLAEGIENLQLEYGLDSSGADGITDSYVKASSVGSGWKDAVSLKAYILARNTEPTPGYSDGKTYVLNSLGEAAIDPSPDNYRRHVYAITARANNIAGRRQQ